MDLWSNVQSKIPVGSYVLKVNLKEISSTHNVFTFNTHCENIKQS